MPENNEAPNPAAAEVQPAPEKQPEPTSAPEPEKHAQETQPAQPTLEERVAAIEKKLLHHGIYGPAETSSGETTA